MKFTLEPSNRKNKKWMVSIDGKTIHFGDDRYEDYTMHKDEARKEAYINRHKTREDWNDKYTAGFWSRWLLWNKPTIKESEAYVRRNF